MEIIDYEIVEDTTINDSIGHNSSYNFEVEGEFEIGSKKGKFVYTKQETEDNGGDGVKFEKEGKFTEEELADAEEYIKEYKFE